MDSRLENIFRHNFRQAEPADTRLGIGRHEREEGRKKDRQDKEKEQRPAWEDRTVVSVSALRRSVISFARINLAGLSS